MARPAGWPRVAHDGGHEAVPRAGNCLPAAANACQRDARPSREEAILMPETKAQRSEAARKGAATRKAHELERKQEHATSSVSGRSR